MKINKQVNNDLAVITLTDIGSNHKRLMLPNQDTILFTQHNNDFVLVVSDGVGSCEKSDVGSKFACQSAIRVFYELQNGNLIFDTDIIKKRLIDLWREQIGYDNPDLYCATLKAAFRKDDIIKLFSIGDGFLIVTSYSNAVKAPDYHDFYTNVTDCLAAKTSPDKIWSKDFRLDVLTKFVVMICTDGISNGIKPGTEIEFVKEIENNLSIDELEESLTNFMIMISENSFDDKTIGVVKYDR